MEQNDVLLIKSVKELEKFLVFEEDSELFFLFKYSPLCMTSFMIEKNFDSWFEDQQNSNFRVAKINVVAEREVSKKVEEKLRIVHESPQLIIFNSDGDIIWYGSHGEINEKKLDEVIKTRSQNAI